MIKKTVFAIAATALFAAGAHAEGTRTGGNDRGAVKAAGAEQGKRGDTRGHTGDTLGKRGDTRGGGNDGGSSTTSGVKGR